MADNETKLLQIQESAPADAREAQRRDFLKKVGTGVFASLLAPVLFSNKLSALAESEPEINPVDLPDLPEPQPDEDPILRMIRDLKRALAKPLEERKWSMVIDLRKCIGCHACTVACVAENKLPPGVVYRPVMEEEIGTYPNVTRRFIPRPCMQCEEPPCVPVCPVNATWKRPDGIVHIDYDACIGCRYCITACPYSARTFDTGRLYTEHAPKAAVAYVGGEKASAYETSPTFDYGEPRPRVDEASPIGNPQVSLLPAPHRKRHAAAVRGKLHRTRHLFRRRQRSQQPGGGADRQAQRHASERRNGHETEGPLPALRR